MLTSLLSAYIAAPYHRGKFKVLRRLLPLVNERPVRSRYGVLMHSRARDFTNFASISGCFQQDYDDVYAQVVALKPGMAFIDIGANAGVFSLVASKMVGEGGVVLSFEPSLDVFRDLVNNAAVNRTRNLFPFNMAVGGETTLARFSTGETSHSGIGHLSENGDVSTLQIQFDAFPKLFDTLIGDRDTVIKIDVEGAEGHVVSSLRAFLRRPQVKTVITEIDPTYLERFGHSDRQVYAVLKEAGFQPQRGLGAAPHYNEVFQRVTAAAPAEPPNPARDPTPELSRATATLGGAH